MCYLECGGCLNCVIEFLFVDEEIDVCWVSGGGLIIFECVVLMVYSKMWLYDVLFGSDLFD